ncbi:MAG: hypothetical protein OXU79_03455 [Gemmatimonadota bacterium]|nr:hypothetical protein [Gemmatimonadota bacterium]
MANRTGVEPRLDYEDLVDELDRFESQAKDLQVRIAKFMRNARQTPAAGTSSGVEHLGIAAD